MAKQVQLRRGSASDHTTFTGAVGELTYVSDDKTLRIHDGSTAGGVTVGTGVVNVKNYGATGDGSTDDTAAIQAAVDAIDDEDGGVVYVPKGDYMISDTIHVANPVLIECEGRMDEGTSSNTSGNACVTFKWTDSSAGYMFVFSDSTYTDMLADTVTGKYLYNCGLVNATLNGNNSAAYGIWAASTVGAKFSVQVRKFKNSGIVVDGGNGALSSRNEFNVRAVWGTHADTEGMNGIKVRKLSGDNNYFATTQNHFHHVFGLVKDGNLLQVGGTDNNIIDHLHGTISDGGTGLTLKFQASSSTSSRNNIVYYMNGDVECDATSRGNVILHHNSEGSDISITSGGQLHYTAIDHVNAERFNTQSFILSDDYYISAGEFEPGGANASFDLQAGQWRAIKFLDVTDPVGTATCSACLSPPPTWNDGEITGVTLKIAVGNTTAGGNTLFEVKLETAPDDSSTSTPDHIADATFPVSSTAYGIKSTKITFGTAIPFTQNSSILLKLERDPADAIDTHGEEVFLMGAIIHYVSDGPANGGSYDVGPVSV